MTAEPRVDVREEHEGRVARLILQAPPENALDIRLLESLLKATEALRGWPSLACVILDSEGRDFSTGLAHTQRRAPYVATLIRTYHAALRGLVSLDALLIAQFRGRCLGAGAEIALVCQAVLADSSARIGFPDLDEGTFPALATLLLPERIGHNRAMDWMLSGRTLQPPEALEAGFVTEYATGWDSLATISDRYIHRHVLPRAPETLRTFARALHQPLMLRLTDGLPELERLAIERGR